MYKNGIEHIYSDLQENTTTVSIPRDNMPLTESTMRENIVTPKKTLQWCSEISWVNAFAKNNEARFIEKC